MAKKKPNPNQKWISQAAEQAIVRYGPELSGLKELMRQATATRDQSIASAKGTAQSTQAAVAAALPFIAQVYGKAGTGAGHAGTLLSHDLQGLGPAADYLKAAGVTEQAAGIDRINAARAFAQSQTADRAVRASEGAQSGVRAAWGQFADTSKGIDNRLQDLNNEIGAFKSATLGDLLATQTKNNHDIAKQRRDQNFTHQENNANRTNAQVTAGVNPDGTVTPGGPKDPSIKPPKAGKKAQPLLPGGVKPLTQGEHNTLRSSFTSAEGEVGGVAADLLKKMGRARANKVLAQGVPEYTEHDTSTGRIKLDKNGAPVVHPGLKPIGEIQRNIILDKAQYGGKITSVTARKLHRMGYSVKALGLTVYKPPVRRPSTTVSTRQSGLPGGGRPS